MSRTFKAAILLFVCLATPQRSPLARPKDRTYSHNAQGLEKQFEPFLKAVGKGDDQKVKDSFAIFALPRPEAWFAQYFSKDQIQQLLWDNEAEVDHYRNSLTMLLRKILGRSGYSVHCELKSGTATTLQPRADAIQPLTPVPTEQYTINFMSADGHAMSQLSNFEYVDGAFRYVGKGAYPFWSMPDVNRKPAK